MAAINADVAGWAAGPIFASAATTLCLVSVLQLLSRSNSARIGTAPLAFGPAALEPLGRQPANGVVFALKGLGQRGDRGLADLAECFRRLETHREIFVLDGLGQCGNGGPRVRSQIDQCLGGVFADRGILALEPLGNDWHNGFRFRAPEGDGRLDARRAYILETAAGGPSNYFQSRLVQAL